MSHLTLISLVAIVVVVLAAASAFAGKNKGRGGLGMTGELYRAKPLLTANEAEFFGRLRAALPEHLIFPQVSLGALLQPAAGKDRSTAYRIRNTFAQKIADFVIADQDLRILAVVELDDRTHSKTRDEQRDNMLHTAGYKVVRWQSKARPDTAEIRQGIGLQTAAAVTPIRRVS